MSGSETGKHVSIAPGIPLGGGYKRAIRDLQKQQVIQNAHQTLMPTTAEAGGGEKPSIGQEVPPLESTESSQS